MLKSNRKVIICKINNTLNSTKVALNNFQKSKRFNNIKQFSKADLLWKQKQSLWLSSMTVTIQQWCRGNNILPKREIQKHFIWNFMCHQSTTYAHVHNFMMTGMYNTKQCKHRLLCVCAAAVYAYLCFCADTCFQALTQTRLHASGPQCQGGLP